MNDAWNALAPEDGIALSALTFNLHLKFLDFFSLFFNNLSQE